MVGHPAAAAARRPWHELLTGRELPGGAVVGLSELLAVSPVALFVGE